MKTDKEIWKDINDYEGLYKVSSFGRIKSFKRSKEKLLSLGIRNGYYVINLRKNGKRKSYQIHRLVAQAFIPNIKNKPFINHKDFNKLNNNINNLEWCTQKENVNWSICNMKHSKKCKNKLKSQYIRKKEGKYELTLKKKYIGRYNTLKEAENIRNKIIKDDDYYKNYNMH